jgi:hypothetical protein
LSASYLPQPQATLFHFVSAETVEQGMMDGDDAVDVGLTLPDFGNISAIKIIRN